VVEENNHPVPGAKPPLLVRLRRFLALGFILILAEPLLVSLQAYPASWQVVLVVTAVVLFIGLYGYLMLLGPQISLLSPPASRKHAEIALLCVLAVACSLILADGVRRWLLLFIFVSVCIGKVEPSKRAVKLVFGLSALAALLGWWGGVGVQELLQDVMLVLGSGFIMVTYAQLMENIRELRAAREELARLAIMEERARFARDLHDLLGHSLSLMALKSELASRLALRAPERSVAEMRDVEREARGALQEVREAVANYRQPVLAQELCAAKELLAAAGMSYSAEGASVALPPAIEAMFGWVVREGVTNVIRHSHAGQCTIRLLRAGSRAILEVIDDGTGTSGGQPLAPGSGLRGLGERAALLGGNCEAGALSGGGFRLAVSLPIERTAP